MSSRSYRQHGVNIEKITEYLQVVPSFVTIIFTKVSRCEYLFINCVATKTFTVV